MVLPSAASCSWQLDARAAFRCSMHSQPQAIRETDGATSESNMTTAAIRIQHPRYHVNPTSDADHPC